MPFGYDKVVEIGKSFFGTFTQEGEDESERQGSRSSQTAISTQVRSSQNYVPRRTDDRTMEDDDDVQITHQFINPIAIGPSRPPRRTNAYKALRGEREQINDPYPEPPPARRAAAPRMTASKSSQASSDRRDEHKFLGTGTPRNPTIIKAPGSESPAPALTAVRKKPTAGRGFTPQDTLNQTKSQVSTKYAGSARAPGATGIQRAKAATKHPDALAYEISRGSNVPGDHEFPDDRSPKRQKTEHSSQANVQKTRMEQLNERIRQKETASKPQASEIKLFPPRQRVAPRSSNWEPSGSQEFNLVEKRMQRPSLEARKARAENTVYEISDDDDEPTAPEPGAKRGRGRPPGPAKKQKTDGHMSTLNNGDRNGVNPKAPSRAQDTLSPWFSSKAKGAVNEPIDVDGEEHVDPLGLRAGVRAALGPTKSERRNTQESENVQSIDDSVEEADGADDQAGKSRRRASKDATEKMAALNDAASEDDELQADIPPSFSKGRTLGNHLMSKQRQPRKTLSEVAWPIEEFKDPDGHCHQDFRFLEVCIHQGIQIQNEKRRKFVRFQDPDKPGEDLLVIMCDKIRDVETSEDTECVYLRIQCSGNPVPWTDIKFRDHDSMQDFVEGLKHVTTLKRVNSRSLEYMTKIYKLPRKQTKLSHDKPVDVGTEEALLARRRGMSPPKSSSRRLTTEGGRPRQRQTLLSQLHADESLASHSTRISEPVGDQRHTHARRTSPTDDLPPSSANRPVRTTRQRKVKEPTPDPVFRKYSDDPGLGERWDQPVIYPEVGRKRVTINFADLFRLDDGEFLNDNLIEFYIRWLQVDRVDNVKEKTAYFFGTHFFSTVSDTSSMNKSAPVRNKSINYAAVERWTAKENLFDYDFVVVPINESAHWYLAIICNLPQVKKKLQSQDTQETGDISQNAELHQEKGSQSHPVNISESAEDLENVKVPDSQSTPVHETATVPDASVEQDRDEGRASTPTKGATQQIDNLSLASPKSASAPAPTEPAGAKDESGKMVDAEAASQELLGTVPKEEPTEDDDPEKGASQISEGILGNAAPLSPEKKKKGKRKSGPGLKKYPSDHLAIVTIDPMGSPHGRAVSVLKDYLIEEASMKHGMEITKDMFQGMTARKGIPQQSNYYDCGVFVCGYMDKFMQDPYKFGEKLLLQEFEEDEDWPEMQPGKMRDQMREMLQNLAKDQKQDRVAKRAGKRALKMVKSETGKDAHSSSRVKQMGMDDIAEEQVEPKPALPPRVARSPSIPTTVQDTQEDEMIMRPEAAAQSRPLTQQMADTAQEPQSSDWKQAVAPGESAQASQESAASTGSEESLDRQVVAGGVKTSSPIKIFEDPPSQGAEATTQDSVIIGDTQKTSKTADEKLDRLADGF